MPSPEDAQQIMVPLRNELVINHLLEALHVSLIALSYNISACGTVVIGWVSMIESKILITKEKLHRL